MRLFSLLLLWLYSLWMRYLSSSVVNVRSTFRRFSWNDMYSEAEAMASGLPVVATDIAGIPEQIEDGDNGFLIPTGDVDTLAARIGELAGDSELRERMAKRGIERAERFSVASMVEKLGQVYGELLEQNTV